jgi:hypothetical protein
MNRRRSAIIGLAFITCAVFIFICGCTRYERKIVPFKMPAAYPNAITAAGALIAAQAYSDQEKANSAFGFDILGTGVLPVQVVFDNQGTHPLEIVPSKTYFIDSEDNLWPIIDERLAYDRISQKTRFSEVAPKVLKPGLLGGAAGAVIGAAIGIVTGTNDGEALGNGAAVGAAVGATAGGISGIDETDVHRQIGEDLHARTLEKRPIPPNEIAHGFIFFPAEAAEAKELRLVIREIDTGTIHNLRLKF